MLQNAYLLAKIGADTAENERKLLIFEFLEFRPSRHEPVCTVARASPRAAVHCPTGFVVREAKIVVGDGGQASADWDVQF